VVVHYISSLLVTLHLQPMIFLIFDTFGSDRALEATFFDVFLLFENPIGIVYQVTVCNFGGTFRDIKSKQT
jgi:hypothetical protein